MDALGIDHIGEGWKHALRTLGERIGQGRPPVPGTGDEVADGVALLAVATGTGHLSARAAARHLGITVDDVADICVAYGHERPFHL